MASNDLSLKLVIRGPAAASKTQGLVGKRKDYFFLMRFSATHHRQQFWKNCQWYRTVCFERCYIK